MELVIFFLLSAYAIFFLCQLRKIGFLLEDIGDELKKLNTPKKSVYLEPSKAETTDAEWKKIAKRVILEMRNMPREKIFYDTQIMKWNKGR